MVGRDLKRGIKKNDVQRKGEMSPRPYIAINRFHAIDHQSRAAACRFIDHD